MVNCPEVEWTPLPVTSRAGLSDLLGSLLVPRVSVSCLLIGQLGPFQLWLKPLGRHSCSLQSSVEIPIRVGQGGSIRAWGWGNRMGGHPPQQEAVLSLAKPFLDTQSLL